MASDGKAQVNTAELRALRAAALPGPLGEPENVGPGFFDCELWVVEGQVPPGHAWGGALYAETKEDADMMQAVINALPAMLEEVERLRSIVQRWEGGVVGTGGSTVYP